jgi:DcrB
MFSSADRRIRPLLLLVVVLALGLPACGSSEEEGVEGSGYTMELPDGWKDRTEDAAKQSPGIKVDRLIIGPRVEGFATNVNVIREARPANSTLEEIEQQGRPQIRGVGGRDISQAKPVELGGERALSHTYRIRQQGKLLTGEQFIAIRDGRVYNVTVTSAPSAFADARKDLREIADSWKWD